LEAIRAVVTDPAEAGVRLWCKFREAPERRRLPCPYVADLLWEQRLHQRLGDVYMVTDETSLIWDDVAERLQAHGIAMGPASYAGHNDGDPAFIRAIWYLVRQRRTRKVIETGVAHGVTSRFV
jgi:hypothetical protein